MLASICALARTDRRRRHPRQDDHHVDADARARRGRAVAELRRRRRRHRRRHRRAVDRRRAARRRGRRERRHPPRAAAARHRAHQRRGRPPRPLRDVRRHHRRASTGTSAHIAGPKVLCADDARCRDLAGRHGAVTYGLRADADVRAVDVSAAARGSFALHRRAPRRGARARSTLPLRGVHNVVNATAWWRWRSSSACRSTTVAAALARFGGVARRFDIRGVDGGATFVDDYAHLPSEIAAVLAGARQSGDGWHRVVAVFQPNRFNRMSEISRRLRRRLRRRRRRRAHRDLLVGHDADPRRHRPARRRRRAAPPTRAPTSCGCRGATTWCRSSPARSAQATCASRWAVATSPRCPRKCSPAGPRGDVP